MDYFNTEIFQVRRSLSAPLLRRYTKILFITVFRGGEVREEQKCPICCFMLWFPSRISECSLAAIQVLNREKKCIRSDLGILSLGNFSIARKKVLVNSENVAY